MYKIITSLFVQKSLKLMAIKGYSQTKSFLKKCGQFCKNSSLKQNITNMLRKTHAGVLQKLITSKQHTLFLNTKNLLGSTAKSSYYEVPSRHGCISDASLRRLIKCLRDISMWADLQISETSPGRLIRDVSKICQVFSETSLSCI